MKTKRNLFSELIEGFIALAEQRVGKRTLRTHTIEAKSLKLASNQNPQHPTSKSK